MSFIYLIWTNKYKGRNLNVYKMGRTDQEKLENRLSGYGKLGEDYFILYYTKCGSESKLIEKQLIKIFKEHFLLYEGNEWFMGDSTEMINIIKENVKENVEKKKNGRPLRFNKDGEAYQYTNTDMFKSIEQMKQNNKNTFLKHLIRYNILEQIVGEKRDGRTDHLRLCLALCTQKLNGERKIFENMFKWLNELGYFKYIEDFNNIILQYTSRKGMYYLIVEFCSAFDRDSNQQMEIFWDGAEDGTNEIIYETMTKIMEFCENPDKRRYYDFEVGYDLKEHFGRQTPVVRMKYYIHDNTIHKYTNE